MAEFNIWCTKLGVNEPGYRAIDFRLKGVPQICDAINLMLQSLRLDLGRLLAVPATAATPTVMPEKSPNEDPLAVVERTSKGSGDSEGEDGDGKGSDISSLSFPSLSSFESSADEEEAFAGSNSGASALWTHIEDTIDRLHGLARRIQDAGAKDRQDRIARYSMKPGPSQVSKLIFDIATEMLQRGDLLGRATEVIKERVAESFARRRTKFAYLKSHETKRFIDPPADPSARPAANTQLQETPEMRQPERPESVASTIIRRQDFPKAPDVTGKDGFMCPYCRLYFPAREARMDRWRHHVFKDFEPYFCIFEKCDAPFDVPNTFEGLLSHMQTAHLPEQWHIDTAEGYRIFDDKAEFECYVRNQGDVPDPLLPTMMEFARRRKALVLDRCDFCGGYPDVIEKDFPKPSMPGAQEALRKHIKNHMHDIALILPPDRDDLVGEENGETDNSSAFSGARTQAGRNEGLGGSDPMVPSVCGRQSCDCRPRDISKQDCDLPAAALDDTTFPPESEVDELSLYQYPDWDEIWREGKRWDNLRIEEERFRSAWKAREAALERWLQDTNEISRKVEQMRRDKNINTPIKIAILDTGLNRGLAAFEKNPLLLNCVKGWKDFLPLRDCGFTDTHGHGTLMARLVMECAPGADIFVARVITSPRDLGMEYHYGLETFLGSTREAILWAAGTVQANVIVMPFPILHEFSAAIAGAIWDAEHKRDGQVVFLASAEKSSTEGESFPACHRSVIAIYATDNHGKGLPTNPRISSEQNWVLGTCGQPPGSLRAEFEDGPHPGVCEAGSSIATAVMASISATMLGYMAMLPLLGDGSERRLRRLKTTRGMKFLLNKMAADDKELVDEKVHVVRPSVLRSYGNNFEQVAVLHDPPAHSFDVVHVAVVLGHPADAQQLADINGRGGLPARPAVRRHAILEDVAAAVVALAAVAHNSGKRAEYDKEVEVLRQ
ncbi:hypothetical protein GGTG_06890 [Gaeumannomyces tritici R3-111a-1]|uniref:Peptidase S8/S53 domain-containing protein n=1 Tax=Gaeumannomyces tritici (strain R3-111a-1) TaxID=644352 RepID=J3P043_GAET3|nr:hypothetical protein GGTG_06890 [Gaeumannomyces tritici R3-111a-1]EJT76976.1 hypothetical protein GGTG_06890 [Gaeumannomyces tritici R3-111a-1]